MSNTERLSSKTKRSFARCIFSKFFRITADSIVLKYEGWDLIRPVLTGSELLAWMNTQPRARLTPEQTEQLRQVLEICSEGSSPFDEELFVERFAESIICERFKGVAFFDKYLNTDQGVKCIQTQLYQRQIPLIDFLHILGVLFKDWCLVVNV
ncbi:MAG: hypothetical protein ABIH67_03305 [Candidatus Uhrbacteria bacterium]